MTKPLIFQFDFSCFDSLVKSTTTTTTPAPTVDSITTADEAIPITIGQVCKPINISNVRQGSSSAEQYWERFVLGIHTAKLGDLNIDINGYLQITIFHHCKIRINDHNIDSSICFMDLH